MLSSSLALQVINLVLFSTAINLYGISVYLVISLLNADVGARAGMPPLNFDLYLSDLNFHVMSTFLCKDSLLVYPSERWLFETFLTNSALLKMGLCMHQICSAPTQITVWRTGSAAV